MGSKNETMCHEYGRYLREVRSFYCLSIYDVAQASDLEVKDLIKLERGESDLDHYKSVVPYVAQNMVSLYWMNLKIEGTIEL